MTSRLDRLFVLLEAGAGVATRRAAALQLGEVQKAHPEELHRLLARLMKHLRSSAWETRVAATQAVEAILSKVPEWHPPPFTTKEEEIEQDDNGRLRCESFDIKQVLEHGAHLMGSEGHEYDLEEEALSVTDMKDRMAKQRQQLNSRLGLDVASSLGMDISGVYSNDDLFPAKSATKSEVTRRPVQELMSKGLSSREMNLAKRKARAAFSKQKSRDCDDTPSTPTTPVTPTTPTTPLLVLTPMEPERKKIKLEPLEELQLTNTNNTANHYNNDSNSIMEDAHQEWLEDMALRLLCVLALDRFGDFVSDQVVAPVRETCAQTLGVALAQMRAPRVRLVAERVATLARQPQWEARHGALLAFKYLLAARQELAVECGALEYLMAGLEDGAEDVSGVAAGALVPAAAALAAARPERLARLAARLWQLLRDQDDLATPANAYMALLASLMALPAAATKLHPIDLTDVLPRLWPYLDHSASSVRKATLQTLRTLTRPLVTSEINGNTNRNNNIESDNNCNSKVTCDDNSESEVKSGDVKCNGEVSQYLMWTPELLQVAMRHIYQRVLFEHVPEIQEIAVQVWQNLLRHAPLGMILVAACPILALWLCLAMQPARMPLDASLLLSPPPPPEPKERRGRSSGPSGNDDEPRPGQKWYLGGNESQPAALRDAAVTRARCLAAEILGYLSCYLVQPAPGIEYKAEDESPIDCYVKVMVVYLRSGSALQRLVAGLVISSWARHTVQYRLYPPPVLTNGVTSEEKESKKEDDTEEQQSELLSKMAPSMLVTTLHTSLNQYLYYDEVALNCNRILQEARDLLAMMKHYKLPIDNEEFNNIVRLEQRAAPSLEERRAALHSAVANCTLEQATLNVSVQAALSSAVAQLAALPERLNPVVRPLMESIKKEASEELQRASARTLAALLAQLVNRQSGPNNKVLVNLKAFLRCDPEFTPRISLENAQEGNGDSGSGDSGTESKNETQTSHGPTLDKYDGIITLREQYRSAERVVPRRGRPPAAHTQQHNHGELGLDQLFPNEDEARKLLRIQRRGATMALTSLTEYFGDGLPEKLPKMWEFITQPLEKVMTDNGRMSDHNEAVRMMSTRCFATLIQLMPLDGAVPEPAGLSQEMRDRKLRDKHFLEQLFNPKSIKDYSIPIPVSAELRSYQQAGVNWLRFLNEYKLHGVLCDDMGLGKTLQSIVVVAGSHYERRIRCDPHMPSLVVCPPTLTGHWVFEVNKFISTKYLKPLQYVGPPTEREKLRAQVRFYNLIVASYDIVRKDIDFFSSIKWNYCVLDEGHVIKNGKTKAFKAIKQIVANHRLILSGTPIQNNVLELWSLFDFLMPGLLGTERQFTARYSRPILAARDPRAPPHHLQAGALACEALHRQVLPFLLRRVKEDVLRELPPKITQDYYCDLSPLQRRLYEHFSREHMPQDLESSRTHVFQALHYLQNVCNHPKLVLVPEHPEAMRVAKQLASQSSSLDDIEHGAKLPALKQLLLDCGIGTSAAAGDSVAVVSQHRALIFCQLKKMLDIVEKDLLQKHLPSVTYLRLDGGVPPYQRHAIVTRFNTDVSIDVLLLTTAVGGLGLNLTGADTVIFVEHDWNPMKDLQAMDRAHRIGQKRVVNVYRLITRDTLEEKIMGLQKFKLMTANTVISSENAAMETMGTDQLLDLFQTSAGPAGPSTSQQQPPKSAIGNLPDLWDDKQYEEEYDMSTFVKSLKKMKA
ncbi:jg4050 [Pararge aegeria aegeria]|uniref:Jg4050 protein n=1 Tax=Pararge aegeria aegeria TaxID=348720 RepID=A0A8S4R626_9NEOP|nr:jg4050 [Pararge aegeria aegeria]